MHCGSHSSTRGDIMFMLYTAILKQKWKTNEFPQISKWWNANEKMVCNFPTYIPGSLVAVKIFLFFFFSFNYCTKHSYSFHSKCKELTSFPWCLCCSCSLRAWFKIFTFFGDYTEEYWNWVYCSELNDWKGVQIFRFLDFFFFFPLNE